ncbi:Putative DNA glycosylase [Fulvia fulva]|uniref:DNA glycosylase n=1 Tax=Passalora fulva TaxID=5499 RepID=A0A9Q8L526_PASFU|nr:Putative DNA glycosylase [Fulvia fulva]UJO10869.1 Putative DNA glycosylase [Fulvia fulva]WPV10415.1 Putative DNA glycosylase [Fulvia fulva]
MARTTRAAAARASTTATETQQLSSPPATPLAGQGKKVAKGAANVKVTKKQEAPVTPASGKKRSRRAVKQEDFDVNELPHNLGPALPTPGAEDAPPPKRAKRSRKDEENTDGAEVKLEDVENVEETKPTPKKTPKKANYGVILGQTPFPDYLRPTPEECFEVTRLLEKTHGSVTVPEAIPAPSLDVAGCGEVPSVLDALIRTRLSANTTNNNSSTAFRGLVARFGTIKEGIGKGSVDWDAVRRAPQNEVFKAIERGGLAQVKSKDIQAIIQIAYEENQERKAALMNPSDDPAGAENEPEKEKQDEVAKAKRNIISLDHLHLLSTKDAFNKMISLPGIGPKTASCVSLFCLKRPSFAVDTHVFRLCQYLGWVPKSTKKGEPKVDRHTTFSHCDVRIPDELKYPLHQLLIAHGKVCPRCRAATGMSSANWEEGCPIEHLVKRHGPRKGGVSVAARKKAKEAALVSEEGDAADEGGAGNASELSDAPEGGDAAEGED